MRASIFVRTTPMTIRKRTLHLILASSASLSFIVCAYVFSGPYSFRPMTVDAATAESLLKSYAVKDTDSDGLPDWQEALYGTDPANPESVAIGVRDGDAVAQGLVKPKFAGAQAPEGNAKGERVPGSPADNTVTAQFAREFFASYVTSYGLDATLSDDQLSTFAQNAVQKLIEKTDIQNTYKLSQVSASGTGDAAVRSYLLRAGTALNAFSFAKEKEELLLMEDAIIRNDLSALENVRGVGNVYTSMSKALIKLQVPTELQAAHLRFANALAALGTVTVDMSTSSTDPVRSLMGLMRYQDATDEVTMSLSGLYGVLSANNIVLVAGEQGYEFYSVLQFANQTEPSGL